MTSTPDGERSTSPSSAGTDRPAPVTRGARVAAGLVRALLVVDRLAAVALVAGAVYVAGSFLHAAWRDSAWWLLVAVPALITVPVLAYHFLFNPRLGGSPARAPGRRRVTITDPGNSRVSTKDMKRREKRRG